MHRLQATSQHLFDGVFRSCCLNRAVLWQGQQNGASAGPSFNSAETFGMTADAVIAACRGVVCWEGRFYSILQNKCTN